ncbi:Ebp2-domain-containing protein [Piedraia hortae CBS 480.64]|uniref:Ebp2-domain-containing protein n=1 Tax=Piedraia hortae CBS 480.64 TaxID=1314780 RepID=A0A6A7C674_9PEZI|nr:Ebp2-domain-containing protein [Piedraia hortae CBS 480.64]
MAKGSKLKAALDRHRGVHYELQRQKKLQKQARKRKRATDEEKPDRVAEELAADVAEADESADGWQSDEEDNEEGSVAMVDGSSSSEEDEGDETFYTAFGGSPEKQLNVYGGACQGQKDDEDDEDDEDAEGGIPLSDLESLASEDRDDLIPHQRLTINNTAALQRCLKSFALPSSLPFSAMQVVMSSEPVTINDVNDDGEREKVITAQAQYAANYGRARLKAEGVPFTRPSDYFAEMVKTEAQMGKIKDKMREDAARKQASIDARKQRDLKKFGKATQVSKLQERAREKKETLEKVKSLKRKRQGADLTTNEEELFDVALEDAAETQIKNREERRGKAQIQPHGRSQGQGKGAKRQKKDEKFGYGGKKRFAKSNDARSAADVSGYNPRKMKGKKDTKRLGKSRRAAKQK